MKGKVNKSPSFFIINSMEKYLKVGKILKAQGLKGEVKVYSTTSFKDIRYKKGSHLFIKDKNGNYIDLVVNTFYSKGENLDVISFMDHDTIESVEPLLNHELFALKDESILFDNEYFYDDLLNLTVFDENNNELGIVSSIEEFPSQITLKVAKKDKHFFFVPFNDFFIKDVNLEDKKLLIHVIEGLIEWNL